MARRLQALPDAAARAWVVLEDCVYPALGCSPVERTLYNHLLRHTLLEGRRVVRRTKAELSRATGICGTAVRDNLRALEAKGCVRIRERAKNGLLIEVIWPGVATEAQRAQSEEALICNSSLQIPNKTGTGESKGWRRKVAATQGGPGARRKDNAETRSTQRCAEKAGRHAQRAARNCKAGASSRTPHNGRAYVALGRRRVAKNPFKSMQFRRAMRSRERGRCFYCLERLRDGNWGLDHVVSRARGGLDDAGNAAACCCECNRRKGETQAEQFLVMLRREGRISAAQLRGRMAAVRKTVASG